MVLRLHLERHDSYTVYFLITRGAGRGVIHSYNSTGMNRELAHALRSTSPGHAGACSWCPGPL